MCFTYVCFVTLSFGLEFILSSEVITKIENATFPNIDLVEIVKENLRRNNEDYGETKYDNNLTSATKGNYEITKRDIITLKVNNNTGLKSNRRINVDSEYDYDDKRKSTTKEPQLITNATTKGNPVQELLRFQPKVKIVKEKFAKKLFKIDIKKPVISHTIKPTTNATLVLRINNENIPKFVNKNKIEKFKTFMAKNKGLLKDFLISKNDIHSQKTTNNKPMRSNDLLNSVMQLRGIGNGIQNTESSEIMNRKLHHISPDMLDMAPAKGGRIHRQRVKGRLCQRHVLVPEGPKYDSQGKWYLPAHNLVVRQPYNVTFPPKFLLPRCCNCCKKSVLGCE